MNSLRVVTLDTKGVCVFCLKNADGEDQTIRKPGPRKKQLRSPSQAETVRKFSLLISRYLHVDFCKNFGVNGYSNRRRGRNKEGHVYDDDDDDLLNKLHRSTECLDLGVVCSDCFSVIDCFCEAHVILKEAELELDWQVRKLKEIVESSGKVSARVETLRERFSTTRNKEEDTRKLEKIESFRKNFLRKCSSKFKTIQPRIHLKKKGNEIWPNSRKKMRCGESSKDSVPLLANVVKQELAASPQKNIKKLDHNTEETATTTSLGIEFSNDSRPEPVDDVYFDMDMDTHDDMEINQCASGDTTDQIEISYEFFHGTDRKVFPALAAADISNVLPSSTANDIQLNEPSTATAIVLSSDIIPNNCDDDSYSADIHEANHDHANNCPVKVDASTNTDDLNDVLNVSINETAISSTPTPSATQKNNTQNIVNVRSKRNTCTTCNKRFSDNYKLRRHMYTHIDPKLWPYQCICCAKGFHERAHYNRHIDSQEHKIRLLTAQQNSEKTSVQSGITETLPSNLANSNDSENEVVADNDNGVEIEIIDDEESTSNIDVGAGQGLSNNKGNATKATVNCSICNKSFQSPSTLAQHMYTHAHPKTWPFRCKYCKKRFFRMSDFMRHRSTVTHNNQKRVYKMNKNKKSASPGNSAVTLPRGNTFHELDIGTSPEASTSKNVRVVRIIYKKPDTENPDNMKAGNDVAETNAVTPQAVAIAPSLDVRIEKSSNEIPPTVETITTIETDASGVVTID